MQEDTQDVAVFGRPSDTSVRDEVARALEAKRDRVEELVGRPVDMVHPSPRAASYRSRVSLRVDGEGRLGFSRPQSHEFLVANAIPLALPELEALLGRLPKLPGLGSVELRTDGERLVVSAWSPRRGRGSRNRRNRGVNEEVRTQLVALLEPRFGVDGVALDGGFVGGDTLLRPEVAGVKLHIGPGSFFQVNADVNQRLVASVCDAVRSAAPTAIVDLYAGVGNLSLPMAKTTAVPVTLVESHPQAASDARKAARGAGLQVEVMTKDAGLFRAGDAFFDVAVLDPPRAGAPGVLQQLVVTRPKRIVYVSCHPKTLARDLREARAVGYRVQRLEIFDMFPQTPHVETLCVLGR